MPILKNDGVRQWEGSHPIYVKETKKCSKPPISWLLEGSLNGDYLWSSWSHEPLKLCVTMCSNINQLFQFFCRKHSWEVEVSTTSTTTITSTMVQNQFTPSSTAISESNEPLLFGFFQKNQKKNLLGLPPRAQMSWKQSKKNCSFLSSPAGTLKII